MSRYGCYSPPACVHATVTVYACDSYPACMHQLPCMHAWSGLKFRVETKFAEQKVDAHGKVGASGQYKYINKSNK